MKSTSLDLRQRILAARVVDGLSMGNIAQRFKIPKGTVQNILERHRDSGSIQPRPHNAGRKPAFAGKGARAVDYAPQGHWNTTTLVAAITCETAIAPMVLDGPMTGLAFEAYIEQVLVPVLSPGAIVVMDNLSAHKSPAIARLLE